MLRLLNDPLEVWLKDASIRNLNVINKIGNLLASDKLLEDLDMMI